MEKELLIRRLHCKWIFIFGLALFLGWPASLVRTQVPTTNGDTDVLLDKDVDTFVVREEELSEVLGRLSRSFRLPVGFEEAEARLPQDEFKKLSFSMPETTTIRDILDRICELEPRYQWKYDEGVVVVRPTEGNQNRLLEGFLSTEIRHISLRKNETLYGIRTRIASAPEVTNYLKSNGVRSDPEFLGSLSAKLGLRSEVIFQDMSVYRILNELAKSTGRIWTISRTADGIYVSIS